MPASSRTQPLRRTLKHWSVSNTRPLDGLHPRMRHRPCSVSKLLRDLQWETLETRRRQQRLVFLYKILKEQVAVPAKSIDITYSSRASRGCLNKQKLYRPGTRTTEYQNSFVHRTIPQWNALPESVAQTGTVPTFKCRLSALT